MAQQQLFINVDMNPKLLEAAKNGNRSQIIELLDKRADIECHDPISGSTPLMVAARVGAKNAVEYLIKRGADMQNTDTYGRTALHLAAWKGNLPVVKFLLMKAEEKQIPIIDDQNNGGDTALHEAAEFGHVDIVEELLNHGAKTEVESWDGTPLCKAAREGHEGVVMVLLAKGANAKCINPNGKTTALHMAAVAGHAKVLEVFMKHRYTTTTFFTLDLTSLAIN